MRHLLILLFCAISTTIFAQSPKQYSYVNKYKDIAISEMERAGVPASIKLAQALLESGAGTSNLSNRAKNHFGIKCGGDRWKGKKYFHKDDDYDANGKLRESCFRVYKNPESSFIAHSDFLRDNPRYDFLFRLNPYDYKRWAHGLKKAGYATSATYPQKLIKLIENLELNQYDRMNANDVIVDNSESYEEKLRGIILNNDVKLVLAKANETPQQLADRVNTKLSKILRYNEEVTSPNQRLQRDERVYIQPKRNSFRGTKKYHYIQAGESLYDIAQLYGVKEEKLRKRNRIQEGQEPKFNGKIKLRGWKVSTRKAAKTSKKVNNPPPIVAEPAPRPGNRLDATPVNDDDEETDGLPPITGGRRPVLTSDTGERGEDFYPEPPSAQPVMPERPVNSSPSIPDPVYYPPTNPTNNPPPADNTVYHTVTTGDTLYNISRRYELSVPELMSLNGLENNVIRKGQQLKVK
ncbi:MAG: LysM repeat protein [Saprospiraceae bacterium]|jgi:LysM repeat protein